MKRVLWTDVWNGAFFAVEARVTDAVWFEVDSIYRAGRVWWDAMTVAIDAEAAA